MQIRIKTDAMEERIVEQRKENRGREEEEERKYWRQNWSKLNPMLVKLSQNEPQCYA